MKDFTKRQRDILYVTIELIFNYGHQALTVKKIALALNITDAALYKHFKSKKELLLAIIELFKRDSEQVLDKIKKAQKGPVESIKMFFMDRCDVFRRKPSMAVFLLNEEMFNDDDYAVRLKEIIARHRSTINTQIAAAQKAGVLREAEPDNIFIMIMGALRLLVRMWKMSGGSFDLVCRGESLWRDLIAALEKNPEG